MVLTSCNITNTTFTYFYFNNKTIKIGNLFYLLTKKKNILGCMLNYLEDNTDLEKNDWHFIEVSKVDDEIISKLIQNLNFGMSDDFFFSFESLLKIGKRAESNIEAVINDIEESFKSKKEIFNILLSCIKDKIMNDSLIRQLYHHDFLIRVKAISRIEERGDLRYLKYLLPLFDDPDDSVRWALIKLLVNLDQIENPYINSKLKLQLIRESNPIIQEKIAILLKEN